MDQEGSSRLRSTSQGCGFNLWSFMPSVLLGVILAIPPQEKERAKENVMLMALIVTTREN